MDRAIGARAGRRVPGARRAGVTVIMSLAWCASGPSARTQVTEPWQAPNLTTVRYDEVWTRMTDPSNWSDWTSRFKFIRLGKAGDVYLVTGLEWRERFESYHHELWGDGAYSTQNYLWSRLLPYADLHVNAVRAFVQPMATYATGVEPKPTPIDQSRVDLLQGFVDYNPICSRDNLLILRAGREMLSLGSERLVGTRYGLNVPLAFDGMRGIWRTPTSRVTAFYLRPVLPGPHSLDDHGVSARALWGVYATQAFINPVSGIDLYYLGYRNEHAVFANASGLEHRQTVGSRLFGTADLLHWNVEALYQFGDIADRPISAWGLAGELGYRMPALPLAPDLTIRADGASGDGKGRTFGTDNALFPKGSYFGELSPIGPYNFLNLNPAVALQVAPKLGFGLSGQTFWRQSLSDGIYGVPGNVLRRAGVSRARFIGGQIEATLEWRTTSHLTLETSFSRFFPGAFIRQTGPHSAIDLYMAEATYRF